MAETGEENLNCRARAEAASGRAGLPQLPFGFLCEPRVFHFWDESTGRLSSAYLQVREGKAVRSFQPDANRLVFFHLDEQELPVGVLFFEPAVGVALTEILWSLREDASSSPIGVGQRVRNHFISDRQRVAELIQSIHDASAALPRALGTEVPTGV